jgi:acyl carrier protein
MEQTVTPVVDTPPPADAQLRQRIVDETYALAPRVLRREFPELSESTRLMEDLGLTSSTMLELMLELEESLELQINVEDLDEDVNTIGRLADYIAGHLLDE